MSSNTVTPQPPKEEYPIVSPYGAISVNAQDYQHIEVPSHSPHSITIHSTGGVTKVSERTPLLCPPPSVPRLRELAGEDAMLTEHMSTSRTLCEELCVLVMYSLPILGTQLFEFSFIVVSIVCIGHISTQALAGATLGSMTACVTGYSIVEGLASALDTLLPPAWTSERPYMVGLWTQRMLLFTGITLIPIAVIWLRAESILLMLNQDPEVARLAGIYLRCACLGLPADSFNCISKRYFESQGLFDVPTRIILVVAPINAFLNWLFVYPLGLSFPGAPLATALSFNIVSMAYVLHGYYYTPRKAWSPITKESLNLASGEIWKGWGLLAKLGIAGVAQTASEWWAWELMGLAASQLGPVMLAAQSILVISASTAFQTPTALSVSTAVRMGNLFGEGSTRRVEVTAAMSLMMAATIGCLLGTVFFVFRHNWGYLFNDDPEVASLVASTLPVIALFQVLDGLTAVVSGIFRARGKQGVSAVLNVVSYYILGIPTGLYLTFVRGHALVGLWEGMMVALASCAGVGFWIGVYGVDWKAEATAARRRTAGKVLGEMPMDE